MLKIKRNSVNYLDCPEGNQDWRFKRSTEFIPGFRTMWGITSKQIKYFNNVEGKVLSRRQTEALPPSTFSKISAAFKDEHAIQTVQSLFFKLKNWKCTRKTGGEQGLVTHLTINMCLIQTKLYKLPESISQKKSSLNQIRSEQFLGCPFHHMTGTDQSGWRSVCWHNF